MRVDIYWMTMGMTLCYNGIGSGGVYIDLTCRTGYHTLGPCRCRTVGRGGERHGVMRCTKEPLISIVALPRDCDNATL